MREVAHLYIENHMPDLLRHPGARKIHANMQALSVAEMSVAESVRKHVSNRVEKFYPESVFAMPDGAVPEILRNMVKEQEENSKEKGLEMSAFNLKQATMADATSTSYHDLFSTIRPAMVVD